MAFSGIRLEWWEFSGADIGLCGAKIKRTLTPIARSGWAAVVKADQNESFSRLFRPFSLTTFG
jgi:hypothetical protein